MRAAMLCALVAGCARPGEVVFTVDGYADVAVPQQGSVITLWFVSSSTPDYVYKFGDGIRLGTRFTAGYETDPPVDALDADGVGVGLIMLLPEFTTIPEGVADVHDFAILGISAEHAVIYKDAASTAAGWKATFPPRFSCGQCVHSPNAGLDSFELTACATVILEAPGTPRCDWF